MTKSAYGLTIICLLPVISILSCGSASPSTKAIPTSFGGITLLDHSISSCMDDPELPCTVSGTIRNDEVFTFSMVTIKVMFLDESGQIVAKGFTIAENLKRGRELSFKVECPLEDFQTDKYDIDIVAKH